MYIETELSLVQGDDQLVPVRTRLLAGLVSCFVRLLRLTWRIQFHDRNLYDDARGSGAVVLAFWHGDLLPLIPLHASREIIGLTSMSEDGALAAHVLRSFGYRVLRGSSSSGGAAALGGCLSALDSGVSPGLAVDGPRGPRHRVKYGAARLSVESQKPIVYVTVCAHPCFYFNSWDRFMLPWPGATVHVGYGCIHPLAGQSVEELSVLLQDRMESRLERLKSSSCLSGD